MNQLGELKENAGKFSDRNVEIIAVFREERAGIEGLKLVREKTDVEFTLALDNGAEQTAAYSTGQGKFDSYVVDAEGVIAGIVKGDLTNRAKSEQLLEIVGSIRDE